MPKRGFSELSSWEVREGRSSDADRCTSGGTVGARRGDVVVLVHAEAPHRVTAGGFEYECLSRIHISCSVKVCAELVGINASYPLEAIQVRRLMGSEPRRRKRFKPRRRFGGIKYEPPPEPKATDRHDT